MKAHTCLPGKPHKSCPACREELRYQRAINAYNQKRDGESPQSSSKSRSRTA